MSWLETLFKQQFFRYILVGFINTFVTACCIFILTYLDVELYMANLSGYVLGVIFSYFLNSIFTFSTRLSISRGLKFLITCIICYLVNLLVISLLIEYWDNIYLVQFIGMVSYTLCGFFINKIWVMK